MIFHRHVFEEEDRQFGWSLKINAYDRMFTLDEPDNEICNPYQTVITLKCSRCPKRKQIFLAGHVHDKTPIPTAFLK